MENLPNRQEDTSLGQKDNGALGRVGAGNSVKRSIFFVSFPPYISLLCNLVFLLRRERNGVSHVSLPFVWHRKWDSIQNCEPCPASG